MKGVFVLCMLLTTVFTLSAGVSSILILGGGLDWMTGKDDEASNTVLGYNIGYIINYPLGNSPLILEQGLRYKTRGSYQEDFYTQPGIKWEFNQAGTALVEKPGQEQVLYTLNETLHFLDVMVRLKLNLSSVKGISLQPYMGISPSILLFSDAIQNESIFYSSQKRNKKGKIVDISEKRESKTKTKDLRDIRSGANIVLLTGIDIQLSKSFTIGLEFDLGLSDIHKDDKDDDDETTTTATNSNEKKPEPTLMTGRMTTQSMMLNIGYKFDY